MQSVALQLRVAGRGSPRAKLAASRGGEGAPPRLARQPESVMQGPRQQPG